MINGDTVSPGGPGPGAYGARASVNDLGPVRPESRIGLLDVLRGFALFGILVVNLGLFAFGVIERTDVSSADRVVSFTVATIFAGKFYLLFSFLFGYGFTLAARRAFQRNRSIVGPWARRLITLFLLGIIHGVLLFQGDILTIYGLLGLLLLALRRVRARTAVLIAAMLISVNALLISVLLMFESSIPGTSPAEIAESYNAWRGGFLDVVAERAAEYGLIQGVSILLAWPAVLAMFLLGLAAAKHGLLESTDHFTTRRLRRYALIGLAVGLPGGVFNAIAEQGLLRGLYALGPAVSELTAPALTFAYICLIILARRTDIGDKVLTRLAPAGRMALTNYLSQSLICAFIFTGYGLGLIGRVPTAWLPVLAITIFGCQVLISDLYFRRFAIGPVEAALRTVTYLSVPRLTSTTSKN